MLAAIERDTQTPPPSTVTSTTIPLRNPDLRAAYGEFLTLQESLAGVQYDVTVLAGDPAPILQNVCGAVSALFAYLIDEESVERDLQRRLALDGWSFIRGLLWQGHAQKYDDRDTTAPHGAAYSAQVDAAAWEHLPELYALCGVPAPEAPDGRVR